MNAEDTERALDAQFRQADIEHRTDLADEPDYREDEFRARWEAIGGECE